MTDLLVLIILGVFIGVDVVLHALTVLMLRDALHTRTMQESVRREWAKVEREP